MSEKQVSTKPFVPADKAMPEFTPTAIILGIILAVVSVQPTHTWGFGSA